MFLFQAFVSYVEAWAEFLNVAAHPHEANRVGAPHDAQSQKKQGVVERPRCNTNP